MRNIIVLTVRSLFKKAAVFSLALGASAQAATFDMTATNVVIEDPSPLFKSSIITGDLTLADTILPGESFGSAAILGLTLNFGGIAGTLADIQANISPGPVQGFGTRSVDGRSFSVFDLRFGFPSSVAGCSFVCAGQIIINSPIGPSDPSNFIAIDDLGGATLSVIDSFDPKFALMDATAVPETATWAMMLGGLGLIGVLMRRRRSETKAAC